MQNKSSNEFVIVVEGFYENLEDARHALFDPFIEDFVEKTGRFRIQNYKDISVAGGVTLGDLSIVLIDEDVFEISTNNSAQVLTRRRAEQLAETLRRQGMFDELSVEPLQMNNLGE